MTNDFPLPTFVRANEHILACHVSAIYVDGVRVEEPVFAFDQEAEWVEFYPEPLTCDKEGNPLFERRFGVVTVEYQPGTQALWNDWNRGDA